MPELRALKIKAGFIERFGNGKQWELRKCNSNVREPVTVYLARSGGAVACNTVPLLFRVTLYEVQRIPAAEVTNYLDQFKISAREAREYVGYADFVYAWKFRDITPLHPVRALPNTAGWQQWKWFSMSDTIANVGNLLFRSESTQGGGHEQEALPTAAPELGPRVDAALREPGVASSPPPPAPLPPRSPRASTEALTSLPPPPPAPTPAHTVDQAAPATTPLESPTPAADAPATTIAPLPLPESTPTSAPSPTPAVPGAEAVSPTPPSPPPLPSTPRAATTTSAPPPCSSPCKSPPAKRPRTGATDSAEPGDQAAPAAAAPSAAQAEPPPGAAAPAPEALGKARLNSTRKQAITCHMFNNVQIALCDAANTRAFPEHI
jgi:hypothetical protein